MRDPKDPGTLELPGIEPKRGRGRPRKPDALTPAQRAKAYRERKKDHRDRVARMRRNSVRYMGMNGETWSGRGLQPMWVTCALRAGQTLLELEDRLTRYIYSHDTPRGPAAPFTEFAGTTHAEAHAAGEWPFPGPHGA